MNPIPILEPLEARIRNIRDLPTLPMVVTKALELLNAPDSTLREVGELIATDQVLSARTLRLVNAPYFGLRRRMDSVVEASVYLGRNGVRNVVVSSAILQSFPSGRGAGPSVRFWEHAFASAIFSRLFALHACPARADEAYLAGLLHDLGRLVLRCHFSKEEETVRGRAVELGQPLVDAEKAAWGSTHADVGFWLGQNWHLPDPVLTAVHLHHCPADSQEESRNLCAAVHLGDEMAFEQGFGDEAEFDALHQGLALGADLLVRSGVLLVSPDSLRELVGTETPDVRMLVEMIYEI